MQRLNLGLCDELRDAQGLLEIEDDEEAGLELAEILARDIVDGSGLVVNEFSTQYIDVRLADNSVWHLPRIREDPMAVSISSPQVCETTVKLMPAQDTAPGEEWTTIQSLTLRIGADAGYWLQRLMQGHFPALQTLQISGSSPPWPCIRGIFTSDKDPPALEKLSISHATIPAETLLILLTTSKNSLVDLKLCQITLNTDIGWQELLSILASRLVALESFSLLVLRDKISQSLAVDWRALRLEDVEEECREGLTLRFRGSPEDQRLTRILYRGPKAGDVLRIIASKDAQEVPN